MTTTSAMDLLFPYVATTGAITVRVSVSFLPEQSHPRENRWFWSYHVRIENHGEKVIQLLARRWLIKDGRGNESEVIGEGVVGEMPVIRPGDSYDYVSGCPLGTPTGSMEGAYQLIDEDGQGVEAANPKFLLQGPAA